MFGSNIFWLIVILWAYISFSVFLARWDNSVERKGTADKLDRLVDNLGELVKEIRLERMSRERKEKNNEL